MQESEFSESFELNKQKSERSIIQEIKVSVNQLNENSVNQKNISPDSGLNSVFGIFSSSSK